MKLFFAMAAVSLASGSFAEEAKESFLPQPVSGKDFAALEEQSPFTRTLNLSDSLILTGVATVDDERVATLLNKETKESFVVSSTLNAQGWKMVELKSDADLEKVAAKVSVDGGEVVTVRYGVSQLKPGESKPGAGRGEESERGDGEGRGSRFRHRGPSPEMREKMSQLSEEHRQLLFRKMREMSEKNPDMSREERGKMFGQMVERLGNVK
ncbi:MAG: hypothetical protein WD342_12565 [Verrucomicrobiales bacterium]